MMSQTQAIDTGGAVAADAPLRRAEKGLAERAYTIDVIVQTLCDRLEPLLRGSEPTALSEVEKSVDVDVRSEHIRVLDAVSNDLLKTGARLERLLERLEV